MSTAPTPPVFDLVDIGANLAHDSFDADRDAVLVRAAAAGVKQIVVTGSDPASTGKAIELAATHRGQLFATAGLHPHHAADWNADLRARYAEIAAQNRIVALGECGLDYFRNFASHHDQRRAFAAQLELAMTYKKPLFLHQRDAHEDFHAMLREHRAALGAVVVHCFTDTQDAMQAYLELGCHIGITGWICDERRGTHLLDAVRTIPDHLLLLETDAPYLLPRTVPKAVIKTHGRRNEPDLLPYVLHAVAQARGQDVAAVATQTARNARAFFGLPALAP